MQSAAVEDGKYIGKDIQEFVGLFSKMVDVPGTTKIYTMGIYPETLKETNPVMGVIHLSMKVIKSSGGVKIAVEDNDSSSRVLSINNLNISMDYSSKNSANNYL